MSFAAELEAFAAKAENKIDQVVRGVVYRCGARLILTSPIDTGAFKSNWYYGLNVPDTRTSKATNIRQVNELGGMPTKASGHNHFLSNSLPYATALEHGHSKQAPKGMVGLIVRSFPKIVQEACDAVGGVALADASA